MRVTVCGIALLLFASVAHAQDGGGPDATTALLHEGDFAYSVEEARYCARELDYLRAVQRNDQALRDRGIRGAPSQTEQFRSEFIGCVESRRRDLTRAANYAAVEAAFERTSAEERACSKDLSDARIRKDPARFQAKFIPCVQRFREASAKTAAEAKKLDDAVTQVATNSQSAQYILSGLLCREAADRGDTLAALAKDRKYSRIGGAVNLTRRAELQDDLASEDDHIARLRGSLRGLKRPALSCKDKKVAFLVSCFSEDPDDRDPDCSGPAGQLLMMAAERLAP